VRNGVADRIQARHSDVFSNVDGACDLIIFDPPFRWFAPRDLLEAPHPNRLIRSSTGRFGAELSHPTLGARQQS
jgi:release factor glutamine methyltransferase